MAAVLAEEKLSLKLVIDKKSQKLIYAESSKEFVDFLFHLLNLPIGSAMNFLASTDTVGAFSNLHSTVANLGDTFMEPDIPKESLLKPAVTSNYVTPLLPTENYLKARKFFTCSAGHYFTGVNRLNCGIAYTDGGEGKGGYVRGAVTYIISDSLWVEPLSTVSLMALLIKAGVRDVSGLEQRDVHVGKEEAFETVVGGIQVYGSFDKCFPGKN